MFQLPNRQRTQVKRPKSNVIIQSIAVFLKKEFIDKLCLRRNLDIITPDFFKELLYLHPSPFFPIRYNGYVSVNLAYFITPRKMAKLVVIE